MDRIIADRKKQLNQLKHILKMQDLLQEYDRQNLYLNRQVDSLLRQNCKLKQVGIYEKYNQSQVLSKNYGYNSRNFRDQQKLLTSTLSKTRKSKYQYLFDQEQLKGIQLNLKRQLKNQSEKKTQTRQIQTNIQEVNKIKLIEVIPHVKFQEVKQIQKGKSNEKNESRSKSKGKQKSQQKKKLEVISNSRIYEEKQLSRKSQTKNILSNLDENNKKTQTQYSKKAYLEESDILEHSFGQSKAKPTFEKKTTLLQSDLPSCIKQHNQIDNSRISDKFMPLSIQSKQLQKNISKTDQKSVYTIENIGYSQSFSNQKAFQKQTTSNINTSKQFRSQSKSKRNHSLYPSPKIEVSSQILTSQVNPFVLLTQQKLQGVSVQLKRNESQKIQRKYIKVVSSKKISMENSMVRK